MTGLALDCLPWFLLCLFAHTSAAELSQAAFMALTLTLFSRHSVLLKAPLPIWTLTLSGAAFLCPALFVGPSFKLLLAGYIVGFTLLKTPLTHCYQAPLYRLRPYQEPPFLKAHRELSSGWGFLLCVSALLEILFPLLRDYPPMDLMLFLILLSLTAGYPTWRANRLIQSKTLETLPGFPPLSSQALSTGRLVYCLYGQGPLLVLLPDKNRTLTQWPVEWIRTLSQRFTLLLIQYPGIGQSKLDENTPKTWVQAFYALILSLGFPKDFACAGHGLGAHLLSYFPKHAEPHFALASHENRLPEDIKHATAHQTHITDEASSLQEKIAGLCRPVLATHTLTVDDFYNTPTQTAETLIELYDIHSSCSHS